MFSITKALNAIDVEFGQDDHDVFAYAPDFAKALGYSSTQMAMKLVDIEDQGVSQRLRFEGAREVRRDVAVIYRDGILELIFRSSLPNAKALKAEIKAILRELESEGFVYDDDRLVRDPVARERARARLEALETRNTFTDVLKAVHSVSNSSVSLGVWAANFTRMMTTRALGISRDEFDARRQPAGNFRDVATTAELYLIESAERLVVARYVQYGADGIKALYADTKDTMAVFAPS